MADLSQIKVGSTTYDIKDTTARNTFTNYLPLTGGQMTGQIVLSADGFRTLNANGYYFDEYGNPNHLNTRLNDYLCMVRKDDGSTSAADRVMFRAYWETGNFCAKGNAAFGGYIGINGDLTLASNGNITDTSKCKLQYNTTTQALDFIFS